MICHSHRMVEVGRDPWRPSGPTLLLRQRHPEHFAQDHIQVGFEYLQRRRFCSLSGQTVFSHPKVKKLFLIVSWNFLFQFVPVVSCTIRWHQWRDSSPILLRSSLKIRSPLISLVSQPFLIRRTLQSPNHYILIYHISLEPQWLAEHILLPLLLLCCSSFAK